MTCSTSLDQERAELRRWTPRTPNINLGPFEQLVINEFLPAERHAARQAHLLGKLLRYTVIHVPYYRDLFRALALSPDDIRGPQDLPRLPVLTKQTLLDQGPELRSEWLPPGQGPPVSCKSTGTTGRPVEVLASRASARMFSILWHRQARWFRYNPESRFVKIRIPSTIPRQHDGSPLPTGSVLESDRWLHLGKYFKTGPEFTFSIYDPMERQVRWLKRIRPDYLLTYPGVFEELGLACAGASPAESLKSLLGIGSCAPPTLRARIEDIYHVPFHQNYGLNEVGIVAIRCLAGRYHVNTEHCVVEIVDDQGRPCPPGESGHLLVTALHNVAMPLIRYDTDDIAVVSEGACPCGRTLPSFGEIIGRYRRYVGLPPNTRKRVRVLGDALSTMPVELTENLRRYQIYQDRNNHFEVRLRTVGPMPAEFAARLQECWQEVAGDPPDPLTIIENAKIVDSPGGKILDFDSEFYLAEDRSALTQIQGHAAPSAENSSPTS